MDAKPAVIQAVGSMQPYTKLGKNGPAQHTVCSKMYFMCHIHFPCAYVVLIDCILVTNVRITKCRRKFKVLAHHNDPRNFLFKLFQFICL